MIPIMELKNGKNAVGIWEIVIISLKPKNVSVKANR